MSAADLLKPGDYIIQIEQRIEEARQRHKEAVKADPSQGITPTFKDADILTANFMGEVTALTVIQAAVREQCVQILNLLEDILRDPTQAQLHGEAAMVRSLFWCCCNIQDFAGKTKEEHLAHYRKGKVV